MIEFILPLDAKIGDSIELKGDYEGFIIKNAIHQIITQIEDDEGNISYMTEYLDETEKK